MCILYAMLKVVSYYDLSVLSMLVGFQKKFGSMVVYQLYPVLFWICIKNLTLQSPLVLTR